MEDFPLSLPSSIMTGTRSSSLLSPPVLLPDQCLLSSAIGQPLMMWQLSICARVPWFLHSASLSACYRSWECMLHCKVYFVSVYWSRQVLGVYALLHMQWTQKNKTKKNANKKKSRFFFWQTRHTESFVPKKLPASNFFQLQFCFKNNYNDLWAKCDFYLTCVGWIYTRAWQFSGLQVFLFAGFSAQKWGYKKCISDVFVIANRRQ